MKNIKELLIIPNDPNKEPYGASVDPADVGRDDIAIDWSLADQIREVTTVPIDSNDPAVLARKADFLRRHGLFPDHQKLEPKSQWAKNYIEQHKKDPPRPGTISEIDLKKAIVEECDKKVKKYDEEKEFVWDEKAKYMITNMMLYFGNSPEGDWPLNKGLLLSGNVGVGKTMLFEVFRDVSRKYLKAGRKNFKMTTCKNVFESYVSNQDAGMIQYTKHNWCFDDLGNEELDYRHFGNSIIPIEEVLIKRYSNFTNGFGFTHLSTNLDPDQIRERYGLRLYDRIMQMCTLIEWKGESRRS